MNIGHGGTKKKERRTELSGRRQLNGKCPRESEDGRASELMECKPHAF